MVTPGTSGKSTAWTQQYPEHMKVKQEKKKRNKVTQPQTQTGTKTWNTRAQTLVYAQGIRLRQAPWSKVKHSFDAEVDNGYNSLGSSYSYQILILLLYIFIKYKITVLLVIIERTPEY